jgi:hypothetical protein
MDCSMLNIKYMLYNTAQQLAWKKGRILIIPFYLKIFIAPAGPRDVLVFPCSGH